MMVDNIVRKYCPTGWTYTDFVNYEAIDLPSTSLQYHQLVSNVSGSFNRGVQKVVRVANEYLYGQFLLKKEEYETRGCCWVKELYHDTGAHNVDSILRNNLDWRLAHRVKYGRGVSFSPSPAYANRQSSRSNGTSRAMIIADVLVQKEQHVSMTQDLPEQNYDTTVGNGGQVYVKYYDDEFYPKFVVYYESNPPPVYYRRYRF